MKTSTLATTLLAAAAASASPVFDIRPDSEAPPLVKRDTEIVYLANCVNAVSCCRPNINYSEIIYYPTSASSQNGAVPPSSNQCTVSSSNFITWEGTKRSCTFSTGVTFTSNIESGAGGRANYAFAGTGYNGKGWNCYKDNQRTLFDPYMPEASNSCKSVYYCLPQ